MASIKCLYFTELENYETLSLKVIQEELLPELAALGVRADLFNISHSTFLKGHKTLDFLLSGIDRHIRYPVAAKRELKGSYDVCHILHNINSTVLFGKPKKCKAVVTCHDIHSALPFKQMEFTLHKGGRARNIFKRIANRAFNRADHIIAVSENTKRDLMGLMNIPEEKISVIYNGVNHSVFCPRDKKKARKRLQISLDENVILNVSSDEPRKNVETILEAVSALKERVEKIRFVHVGELSPVSCRIIRKNNLAGLVRNVSVATLDALCDFYNAADIFVFPSFYEGFGLPVLEAMACGCPVISSDRSSLPEVAGMLRFWLSRPRFPNSSGIWKKYC